MYRLAATLDPGLATARLARRPSPRWRWPASRRVGEFHYLHHGPGGRPYDDPNAMGDAVLGRRARGRRAHHAARHLLPARRDRPGPPNEVQQRFTDGDGRAWAARAAASATLARRPRSASAPRSTPSAPSPPEEMADRRRVGGRAGRAAARPRVSEQPAENEACLAAYGRTPVEVLAAAGAARRALHRRPRHPPDRRRRRGPRVARPRVLLPDDRARPGRRHRSRGRARRRRRGAVPGLGLPRGDRPVRGGAGGGARRAAGHRRPRPPPCQRPAGGGHVGRRALARLGRRRSPRCRGAGRPHRRRPRQRPPGRRRTRPPRRGGGVRRRRRPTCAT